MTEPLRVSSPIPRPRAVLWDLDGTLVDSEPFHRQAILRTLDALGVALDGLDESSFVGRGERDFWQFARERFGLEEDPDALVGRKDRHYAELVRGALRTMPGAIDCLTRLDARAVPMAVASGSSPRAIAAAVSETGLGRFFQALVSSLDPEVPRSKPHPDVFLTAARRLGVEPSRCLVVEDAAWGVRAAKAAGMRVIAIPNAWTRAHDLTGADWLLTSLDELRFDDRP